MGYLLLVLYIFFNLIIMLVIYIIIKRNYYVVKIIKRKFKYLQIHDFLLRKYTYIMINISVWELYANV